MYHDESGVSVTIMNFNTADSHVTAISLNGDHARNYLAKGASGISVLLA